jgi:tRNA (guanine37-N1)-methyltransferase
MWFGVISSLPQVFSSLEHGVTGRALKKDLVKVEHWNPRDFTTDKHRTIDDRPYGGGPGMLMMAEPLQKAIQIAKSTAPTPSKVIYLSPQGRLLKQNDLNALLNQQSLVLLAGRYEGIDERVIKEEIDEEWSIGDYVLSGGELAAMVMIDSIARLIPGVLGHDESASQDSLYDGLLKYPQYTRPENFQGAAVPPVLMSGNHRDIARWRLKQALGATWRKRPDLLNDVALNEEQRYLLDEFVREWRDTEGE